MSSSEDESAVQNIVIRSKRSERTPIEIEVTELIKAKLIASEVSTSIPALQLSLKQDLNTQNQLLNDAIESEKMMQSVVRVIEKAEAGEITIDLAKEEHQMAQKFINNDKKKAIPAAQEMVRRASDHRLAIQDKVLKISKQLNTSQSVKPVKGENDKLRQVGERYYAAWTTPCPAFMLKHNLMPQKLCPRRCYHDLRFLTVEEPEKITHQEITKKLMRYKDALPDVPGVGPIKNYYQDLITLLNKMVTKSNYTKAQCLRIASGGMSDSDQLLIDSFLRYNEKSASMMQMADKVVLERMKKIAARKSKGDDHYVPANPKSIKHQLLHASALKENYNPFQSSGYKKKQPKKRKGGKPKNQKKNKKSKKGRATHEHDKKDDCKSLEKPSRYDTTKIPAGLHSFDKISKKDKSVLEKQLRIEGIDYQIDLD